MLSEAKHLQYLAESKQMQILRFAQDDGWGGFFRRLPAPGTTRAVRGGASVVTGLQVRLEWQRSLAVTTWWMLE